MDDVINVEVYEGQRRVNTAAILHSFHAVGICRGPESWRGPVTLHEVAPRANNESSEVFDIIKPGWRVKIKGYRQ